MIDWLSPVVHFTFILIILSWQDWQTNLIQTVWLLWPISLAVIQHNFSWSTIILYILFLTLNNITDEIFIGNGDTTEIVITVCAERFHIKAAVIA